MGISSNAVRVAKTSVVGGRAVKPTKGVNPTVSPEISAVDTPIEFGNVVFGASEKWTDGPAMLGVIWEPVPVGRTEVLFRPWLGSEIVSTLLEIGPAGGIGGAVGAREYLIVRFAE